MNERAPKLPRKVVSDINHGYLKKQIVLNFTKQKPLNDLDGFYADIMKGLDAYEMTPLDIDELKRQRNEISRVIDTVKGLHRQLSTCSQSQLETIENYQKVGRSYDETGYRGAVLTSRSFLNSLQEVIRGFDILDGFFSVDGIEEVQHRTANDGQRNPSFDSVCAFIMAQEVEKALRKHAPTCAINANENGMLYKTMSVLFSNAITDKKLSAMGAVRFYIKNKK